MELSPDSSSTVEYADGLPRPTLLHNLGFWLLTMLLGLGLILLLPALTGSSRDKYSFVIAVMATILSLAALPLLLLRLPWALTAPSVDLRWLRVFTLQSLSLGGLTALGYVLAGGRDHGGFGTAAPLVGTIYFVAGLLAAVPMYWPWLRRS